MLLTRCSSHVPARSPSMVAPTRAAGDDSPGVRHICRTISETILEHQTHRPQTSMELNTRAPLLGPTLHARTRARRHTHTHTHAQTHSFTRSLIHVRRGSGTPTRSCPRCPRSEEEEAPAPARTLRTPRTPRAPWTPWTPRTPGRVGGGVPAQRDLRSFESLFAWGWPPAPGASLGVPLVLVGSWWGGAGPQVTFHWGGFRARPSGALAPRVMPGPLVPGASLGSLVALIGSGGAPLSGVPVGTSPPPLVHHLAGPPLGWPH